MWIGSRRIVDENPEFAPEVDVALREYRGPGTYRHTGERLGTLHAFIGGVIIENEQDFDQLCRFTW